MVSETFRHGYYLAARDLQAGDASLAKEAQAFYLERLGLDPRHAERYDGVSIYTRPDGKLAIRAAIQNFFTDRVDVCTHDYPVIEVSRMCSCGGSVSLRKPDGDFIDLSIKGLLMSVAIPTHILIDKCGSCGETYLGQSDYQRICERMYKELS